LALATPSIAYGLTAAANQLLASLALR
jgi:hypothetical protein